MNSATLGWLLRALILPAFCWSVALAFLPVRVPGSVLSRTVLARRLLWGASRWGYRHTPDLAPFIPLALLIAFTILILLP